MRPAARRSLATSDSPQSFWLQQREQADQNAAQAARAAARPARKPLHDFVPAEATRTSPTGAPIEPTFFINVLGDSVAVFAAEGLTQAFVDKPEIAVVGRRSRILRPRARRFL